MGWSPCHLAAAIETGTRVQAVEIIQICRKREQREILPVHVVLKIENFRETGAGDLRFVPCAVRLLPIEKETKPALDALSIQFAAGADAHQRPRGLRGGAFAFAFQLGIVIRGTGFATTTVL